MLRKRTKGRGFSRAEHLWFSLAVAVAGYGLVLVAGFFVCFVLFCFVFKLCSVFKARSMGCFLTQHPSGRQVGTWMPQWNGLESWPRPH